MYKSPNKQTIRFIRNGLIGWGKRNYRKFPWRHTKSKFHALIAEILLQRTKADQVLPVYKVFTAKYKTPYSLSKAGLAEIKKAIKSLGLLWRAGLIKKLAVALSEEKSIACDYHELLKLPAVGPYVASAFTSFHCNKFRSIIDSNVVRLYGRLFGIKTGPETRRSKIMSDLACLMTPRKAFKVYNYAVLDHTAAICISNPKCEICPIRKACIFYLKGSGVYGKKQVL